MPPAVTTGARKRERMGVSTSLGRVPAMLICLRLGRRPPHAFFADTH